jgi:hypothetical protein
LSREELIVSGRPTVRVELVEPQEDAPATEAVRLTYWISVGPNTDAGPTIVATTSTDAAGNYPINMAVLDRMMELLVIHAG